MKAGSQLNLLHACDCLGVLLVLQVVINDRVVRSFSLTNMGQVNFDYVWAVGASPLITVKPQSGSVPKGERRVVEVSFAPNTPDKLTDYQVSCQVRARAACDRHYIML